MKMDVLSIFGIIVAFMAIVGGNFIEGGHLSSLLQFTAFIIVIGGTLGAVLLQSPLSIFMQAAKMGAWVFVPPSQKLEQQLEELVEWSRIARREGLLGLERIAEDLGVEFSRKGLQMVVDGSEPDSVRKILELDLDIYEQKLMHGAKVYEAAGGYAPTIGIIGAVMGLIHVMENLADPSKLGAGIAVAFVATIYGVGSANLLFLPIASKLKTIVHLQVTGREMIIEGLASIADGENPKSIESRLQSYLT